MVSGGPLRILTGRKRPGEPLRIVTSSGEIPLRPAAPKPTQPTHNGGKMTTQPLPSAASVLVRIEAYDAEEHLIVSVKAPIKVAANAARNWADLVDPWEGPAGLDMRHVPWRDWLSKLLPLLRKR